MQMLLYIIYDVNQLKLCLATAIQNFTMHLILTLVIAIDTCYWPSADLRRANNKGLSPFKIMLLLYYCE